VIKTSSYRHGKFYTASKHIRNLRKKDKKYRYLVMKLPWDKVPDLLDKKKAELADHVYKKGLKFKQYDKVTDAHLFASLVNKIILTSPDPYRSLEMEDAFKFSEGTFIVYLHGQPIGFLVCTIEEENGEKLGVIAGLGLLPRYRRRKIGMLICMKAAEYFEGKNVDALICDVYENNKPSYSLITSLGFEYYRDLEMS